MHTYIFKVITEWIETKTKQAMIVLLFIAFGPWVYLFISSIYEEHVLAEQFNTDVAKIQNSLDESLPEFRPLTIKEKHLLSNLKDSVPEVLQKCGRPSSSVTYRACIMFASEAIWLNMIREIPE